MLPFLKNKRIQTMMVAHKREGEPMDLPTEEHPLASAAEDLIHAVHSKNIEAVAQALEAAFQIFDSLPHEEGTHL